MASHSNCRALASPKHADRHLSDDMIKALVSRGGVIGIVLFTEFLADTGDAEPTRDNVTLKHVVAHIKRICDIAGDTRHVGIGSDIDGGFGRQHVPAGIETSADLKNIAVELSSCGFTEDSISAILGGNWHAFFFNAPCN